MLAMTGIEDKGLDAGQLRRTDQEDFCSVFCQRPAAGWAGQNVGQVEHPDG